MDTNNFPILEFDESKTAIINPDMCFSDGFDCDKMVITFFPEVITKLKAENLIKTERIIPGENPVEIFRFADSGVLLTLGQVGCPACGGNLDLFCGMGIKKVMFCGGGGVLDKEIKVGQLLLVEGAIRDEGFSYHYIAPSRCVYTNKAVTDKIADYLEENKIPYIKGLTWTTDAIFRETRERAERRKSEGAKIVEMEQAGCIAVTNFRGIDYGALIYGGDDVSGEQWDNRGWQSRGGIRYNLVMLCRELVCII